MYDQDLFGSFICLKMKKHLKLVSKSFIELKSCTSKNEIPYFYLLTRFTFSKAKFTSVVNLQPCEVVLKTFQHYM